MSKSRSDGEHANYRWKKARGKTRLSPLRARVHDLLEKSPTSDLSLEDICKILEPPSNSRQKKTAVRMAVEELCDKGLVDTVESKARSLSLDEKVSARAAKAG